MDDAVTSLLAKSRSSVRPLHLGWLVTLNGLCRFVSLLVACAVLTHARSAPAAEPTSSYRVRSTEVSWISELVEVAVSKDGRLIAVGAINGTVQVWDWQRATMILSRQIEASLIENLFFMDDDRRLSILYSDGDIAQHHYVWELATGDVADEEIVDGLGTGYFMPDGTIGLEHSDGVAFMDQKGKYANRYVQLKRASSIALSPDGRFIAAKVGFADANSRKLTLFNREGKFVKRIDIGFDYTDPVFSPNSKIVAVRQRDKNGVFEPQEFDPATNGYDLYDVATGRKLHRFRGHTAYLTGARFSPDGHMFLTFSKDGTMMLWDLKTGTLVRRITGHRDRVSRAAFLADGALIVSCSFDGSTKIWSVRDGREIVSLYGRGVPTDPPSFLALKPDGGFIEAGPRHLEIFKMNGTADGPALLWEERRALKLKEMSLSAN